ncbi:phenol hydroxylase, partial [Rhodococcus wratislaviensis IFP 2016]
FKQKTAYELFRSAQHRPLDRRRQRTDPGGAVHDVDLEQVHGRRPDEPGDEAVDRLLVQRLRARALLQDARFHDRHTVAHGHGLHLIVGDVHGGGAQPALQQRDLGAGLHPQFRVEVRQRFVHEEHLRVADDRPAHRDTLALPTGECLRLAVQVVAEIEDLRGLLDAAADLTLVHAGDLEGEAHVLRDRHVGVQRVVLEHHRDVPFLRCEGGDVAFADADGTVVDVLETGQHPQRRRLAAPGGADEDEEFAVLDVEVQRIDGRHIGTGVHLGGCVVRDSCHGVLLVVEGDLRVGVPSPTARRAGTGGPAGRRCRRVGRRSRRRRRSGRPERGRSRSRRSRHRSSAHPRRRPRGRPRRRSRVRRS